MYWTDRIDIQIDHHAINTRMDHNVFSKAYKNSVGQANMSRQISNTMESSIKPSEDRQFIYADGEYNINRPSRCTQMQT